MAKEEENYITIVNIKEENQRLSKQVKSQATQGGATAKGANTSERELAKLSVENELLKKQVEELEGQLKSLSP